MNVSKLELLCCTIVLLGVLIFAASLFLQSETFSGVGFIGGIIMVAGGIVFLTEADPNGVEAKK